MLSSLNSKLMVMIDPDYILREKAFSKDNKNVVWGFLSGRISELDPKILCLMGFPFPNYVGVSKKKKEIKNDYFHA